MIPKTEVCQKCGAKKVRAYSISPMLPLSFDYLCDKHKPDWVDEDRAAKVKAEQEIRASEREQLKAGIEEVILTSGKCNSFMSFYNDWAVMPITTYDKMLVHERASFKAECLKALEKLREAEGSEGNEYVAFCEAIDVIKNLTEKTK